jgi:hypothetical protein
VKAVKLLDASEGKFRALVTHLGRGTIDGWEVARLANSLDGMFVLSGDQIPYSPVCESKP